MGEYDDGHLYEASPEHQMARGEGELLASFVAKSLGPNEKGARVLDFGCGTGLVAGALKHAQYTVAGIDPRPNMIADGLKVHSELEATELLVGDATQPELFPAAAFDAITSRQVMCHLTEVETVFATWRDWLCPGGALVLVDGYWSRSSWKPEELTSQPFAALSSAEPVREALEANGFHVLEARAFIELDALRSASFGASVPRYLVTARTS